MADLGALRVFMTANTSPFNAAMSASTRGVMSWKTAIVAAGAVAAGAIAKFTVGAIQSYAKERKAQLKLQATLKATGNAAEFTSKQLIDFAGEMQQAISVADDEITSSLGVLTTFKNVSGDVFKETAKLAFDMSAVMDQNVKQSMVQLGKAINDPKAQLSALSRVGVTFTEQQKEQVKALQDSGDLLGAQGILLKELRSEFGGAAEEMAKAEPWKQLTLALGDVMDEMGKILTMTLELNDGFLSLTDTIRGMTQWLQETGRGVAVFIKTIWIELKFSLMQTWDFVRTFFVNYVTGWKNIFVWVLDSWRDMWHNMVQVGKNAWDIIKKALRGEDVDFMAEFSKELRKIDLPELPPLIDLDRIEAIEKEKLKALANISKQAIASINEEQKKDVEELKRVEKIKKERAMKATEPAEVAQEMIRQQFAAAVEKNTAAGFSAGLGRTFVNDPAAAARETAENTRRMVEIAEEDRAARRNRQQMTIGMSRGN